MTQERMSVEVASSPEGLIFLSKPTTLEEIDKEMFHLYQNRGKDAKSMDPNEKYERAVELDKQKARLMGAQAITAKT